VGAPQAIDQVHLYGRAVRWFGDPGVPDASGTDRWRPLAARAYAAAVGPPAGPVQLNLPFREPLVGTPGPLPPARDQGPWARRPARAGGAVGVGVPAGRVLIVAGAVPGLDGGLVHAAAAARGWPVVAEPRSAAWLPADTTVTHLDAILRSPRAAEVLRPEVIVRLGAPGSSRVVNEWLAASGAPEIVLGAPAWSDPAGTAALVSGDDPTPFLEAACRAGSEPDAGGWLDAWQAASRAAAKALADELDGEATATEPGVARSVTAALPDGARLVISSSMPIRDVERYAAPRSGLTTLANRGANGIDGVVSTALGVALGSGVPTALLVGDIALLHDSNGLLGAAARNADLVCVVVDNDGGGIFSFLPQATALAPQRFETLFGTPHGIDLVALASAYGVDARWLTPGEDVAAAVTRAVAEGGVRVLVVPTDRAANVAVHRRLDEAMAAAVEAALGT
jgi:2-succinyl-5-enolpyruvyl-6-hydroxy-3-cyclohexene-1-carboxylate synthase